MEHFKSWQTALRLLGLFVGLFLFFRYFGAVLLPFALGLIPAKAASRAADRLQEQLNIPRKITACLCVAVIYTLLFLLFFFLGKLLFRELERFFRALPELACSMTAPAQRLKQTLLRPGGTVKFLDCRGPFCFQNVPPEQNRQKDPHQSFAAEESLNVFSDKFECIHL